MQYKKILPNFEYALLAELKDAIENSDAAEYAHEKTTHDGVEAMLEAGTIEDVAERYAARHSIAWTQLVKHGTQWLSDYENVNPLPDYGYTIDRIREAYAE